LPPSKEAHAADLLVPPSIGTTPPVTIEQYCVAESHVVDPHANGCPTPPPLDEPPLLEPHPDTTSENESTAAESQRISVSVSQTGHCSFAQRPPTHMAFPSPVPQA
jgi:hypothetical protein